MNIKVYNKTDFTDMQSLILFLSKYALKQRKS